jgi:hypothetical protein
MFADKSMQGLTFLLSAFPCQAGKIERPYTALCLQMARLALLSDGARLQMGSPEAARSKLLLSGSVPGCSHAKEGSREQSRLQPGAEWSVYAQFHVPGSHTLMGPLRRADTLLL